MAKLPYEAAATPDAGYDFRSANGRKVITLKSRVQGVRELHAALLQLALSVERDPKIEQASLVVGPSRLTRERLEQEWASFARVLRPGVARRLAVVAIGDGATWSAPKDADLSRVARWARERLRGERGSHADARDRDLPSPKFFEVWKVLLERWLRRGRALPVTEVMRLSGCSYPTVAAALRRLDVRHELARQSNRSVELRAFPKATAAEVLTLSESLRRPVWFVDRSGGPSDAQALLRRLRAKPPRGIALGGVIAARSYDPDLDLHGIPRIDLTLHAPKGAIDLGFVERLDPALERSPAGENALLVVHPLLRPHDLFERAPRGDLPFADPVETLLDLHELRLYEQADAFVRALRKEAPR